MVQWLRLHAPKAGGPGSIPGQGTGARMPQQRVHTPHLKIPHAAVKTWYSQMNKENTKKHMMKIKLKMISKANSHKRHQRIINVYIHAK